MQRIFSIKNYDMPLVDGKNFREGNKQAIELLKAFMNRHLSFMLIEYPELMKHEILRRT